MKVYAFIFARGGSKGLRRKNIKKLNGVPLIAYSIKLAKTIDQISEVFVSTEDDEIADVARQFGAEVIARPPELASDTASEWSAWQHAVDYLENQGRDFDVFLSLPATSPLRSVEDVTACLNALQEGTDMVVTVTPASRSPYFNMVKRSADGDTEILVSGTEYQRRQDAPEAFDMTTVAYVASKDFVRKGSGVFSGNVKSVVVPKQRAVDIDDEYDFKVAEALLRGDWNA